MNKAIFKGQWKEIKGKIKQKWGDLTEDELLKIEGNNDEIFGILEKRYGYAREEAQKLIDQL